jgi:hypothetical protein
MNEINADKTWRIKGSDGVEIIFRPIFVVKSMAEGQTKSSTNMEVECTMMNVKMKDPDGKETTWDIPFQEIYMFIYFCCNEEKRQQLQLQIMRQITEIPYEVTFKLDRGEMDSGMAKRLIKVPVDEITMSIARSEAQMFAGKANLENINTWFKKKQDARKGRNKLSERLK